MIVKTMSPSTVILDDDSTVTVGFEEITPEMAQELLDRTDDEGRMELQRNRTPFQRRIDVLTKRMKEGTFYLRPSALAIMPNGSVMEGQHRLISIINSQTTQTLIVVRGLQSKSLVKGHDDGIQ